MTNGHETVENSFRQEIGYGEVLRRADRGHDVVADWPDPRTFFKFSPEWQALADKIYFETGGVERIWVFAKGEARISLKVFVSSTGPDAALHRLVSIATNTMMMESPFRQAPFHVGDVAVILKGTVQNTIIWCYKNVLFQIKISGYQTPLLPLAQSMQAFAERHVVPSGEYYLPRIDYISIEPKLIYIGNKIKATVFLAPGTKSERLAADFSNEGKSLSIVAINEWDSMFDAVEAGESRINVRVVDRGNLMSMSKTITVRVLDNP